MDLILLVTFVTALATLAMSIVAILTLFEMKKQREAQYKPEPVVEIDPIFLNGGSRQPLIIKFGNIGFGVAKNIKISVQLKENFFRDLDKLMKTINLLEGVTLTYGDGENSLIFHNKDDDNSVLYFQTARNRLEYETRINYILPDKPIIIELPDQYTFFFYLLAICMSKGGEDYYELSKYSILRIELEYDDIGGKRKDKLITLVGRYTSSPLGRRHREFTLTLGEQ